MLYYPPLSATHGCSASVTPPRTPATSSAVAASPMADSSSTLGVFILAFYYFY
jgi:hypothetical protein